MLLFYIVVNLFEIFISFCGFFRDRCIRVELKYFIFRRDKDNILNLDLF